MASSVSARRSVRWVRAICVPLWWGVGWPPFYTPKPCNTHLVDRTEKLMLEGMPFG